MFNKSRILGILKMAAAMAMMPMRGFMHKKKLLPNELMHDKDYFKPNRRSSNSGGNKGLHSRMVKRRAKNKAGRIERRRLRQWPKHSMRRA